MSVVTRGRAAKAKAAAQEIHGAIPVAHLRATFFDFLSALVALLFAGCGNNPNPEPLQKTRADGSPWLVRYAGLSEDPRSFDPQFMYDQMSRRVLEAVYDTLLEYHPMKTDPYEVRPALLAEMPLKEVSPEGKISYLCRLKTVARYHDDPCFPEGKGRQVVAGDVHYAFQRLCDPKVESPFLSNLAEYITGLQEAHDAAAKADGGFDYSTKLKGIDVIDAQTFRIHLTKPYPQIIYWLSMHCTTPVAREAVEYYDGKEHGGVLRPDFHKFYAVGHGPYRIQQYKPRQRVRLERVEGYATTTFPSDGFPPEKAAWLHQFADKPLPLTDEVHFSIIRENIPIFILTRQGYLDGMGVNKDAFNAMITPTRELAPKYRERGMFLEKDVEPSTFWISFNMDDPVLGKNKKLRQALSCASDAQTYSDIFYNSVAPVAQQLVPPGIFGHDHDWRNPYGYDVEKGRRLIAEAGYPDGRDASGRQLELTMDCAAVSSDDRQRVEFVQRNFERLGIKVKVIENTFAHLLRKEDTGDFQMADGTGWGADYPDPENFFFLLYSKNVPPAGKNISRFKNAEFDRLFEQMATMENGPERLEIVRKMNTLVAEECPQILNFHKAFYTAVQPWAPRTHNNLMLEGGVKYLTIDPEKRAQLQREWNRKPVWPLALLGVMVAGAIGYAVRWNRRLNA